MPRRAFLLRYARPQPPDAETEAKYLRRWAARDLYRSPHAFPNIASKTLFGDGKPLEFEIGAGTGEFLCDMAARRRDVNFVGCDISLKSLLLAVERARSLSHDNVIFIQTPVRYLYPLLPTGSLQAVYLHFPEPFLKPSTRKHRVFNAGFLDNVHSALAPGGRLSVATDSEEAILAMLALLEADPRFRKTHVERYLRGLEAGVKSRYQEYWERLGVPVLRFEAQKLPSPTPPPPPQA
ncbi:MAG: tRNA (guanine(46)-N(7))-methyltransferase TrmB [Chloroflexia bacterium]